MLKINLQILFLAWKKSTKSSKHYILGDVREITQKLKT